MTENQILIVLSTCPDAETAAGIARTLVQECLTACVNIVPAVRSIYAWQGELQDESEVLMVLKTTSTRFADLKERLLALHPYEIPEVVAVSASGGHHAYFDWVTRATRTPGA
jgi:periplasmic divalent cation tolerance protein